MMKNTLNRNILLFLLIVFTTSLSCQDKDKEAIKTVVENLLKAHTESDYDTWIKYWANQPYVFLSHTNNEGQILWYGRENLQKMAKVGFQSSIEAQKKYEFTLTLEGKDYFIRVYSESAWAQFKINWIYKNNKGETYESESFENYVFEKENGDWKVATINAVGVSTFKEQDTEEEKVAVDSLSNQ